MKVLIVGANGKIGRHLVRSMAASRHQARAMIRAPEQAGHLQDLGAETVVADLEGNCRHALADCDAVVFTAGSGPHTGPEKTVDVDQNGAINLIDTTSAAGVARFLMVSSMRADNPEAGPVKLRHYLHAKKNADDYLRASGLDYTIVRPGRLTEDAGSGRVRVAERLEEFGEIPREDVAAALLFTLDAANTIKRGYDLLSGDERLAEAIARL